MDWKKVWKMVKYIYDPYKYPIKTILEGAKIYNEFGDEENNENRRN